MNGDAKPIVDGRGFVTVDGVKIGRLVRGADGQTRIQFCDKNRHRSHLRGTRFVEVPLQHLSDVAQPAPNKGIDKSE